MSEFFDVPGMVYADAAPFLEFQAEMLREIVKSCGLSREELARFAGLKQCLSCGAYQSIDGTLPCDH